MTYEIWLSANTFSYYYVSVNAEFAFRWVLSIRISKIRRIPFRRIKWWNWKKCRGLHHGERVEREPIYIRGSGALNISRRQAPGSPQFQHWPNHVVLLFLAQNISSSIQNLRRNFQLQCLKLRNFFNSFVNSLFAFYLRTVRRIPWITESSSICSSIFG